MIAHGIRRYCNLHWNEYFTWRHALGHLVETLRYEPWSRGFDSGWCHWHFWLTQSFQPRYGPGVFTPPPTQPCFFRFTTFMCPWNPQACRGIALFYIYFTTLYIRIYNVTFVCTSWRRLSLSAETCCSIAILTGTQLHCGCLFVCPLQYVRFKCFCLRLEY
jgi:hypothetical protein